VENEAEAGVEVADEGGFEELDRLEEVRLKVSQVFKPSVPISQRDLFAGRIHQMDDLIEVSSQPGQHAVVYGERGVGKTSLASVVRAIMAADTIAVKVNCAASDTFSGIWRRVLDEVTLTNEQEGPGYKPTTQRSQLGGAALLRDPEDVHPDDVRRALVTLSRMKPVLVFLDEFDRVEDPAERAKFADTLKTLSDQDVQATVVLVGVADNVDELVAEHRSVERALVQIPMPRMSADELQMIVRRGLNVLEMDIHPAAVETIAKLSQGLPHYTHLLAQHSAYSAISNGTFTITAEDVRSAVAAAIKKSRQSVRDDYHAATVSNRADSLYREVLLASALVDTNELGWFAAGDLRGPLSKILGREIKIANYATHLKAFCGEGGKRRAVLQRTGKARLLRYRFLNPLLQPYGVMKGLEDGLITIKDVRPGVWR
jgi:Cdc6-like AAA superfamily ATPase